MTLGWGQRKAWIDRTLQKLVNFMPSESNFKPGGIELEFQNHWERVNNKNHSWFSASGMKCCNISIIHMWVHVIYLQLELLSIQQLKPKNCWYTADEKTFATLPAPAFLKLSDDHNNIDHLFYKTILAYMYSKPCCHNLHLRQHFIPFFGSRGCNSSVLRVLQFSPKFSLKIYTF